MSHNLSHTILRSGSYFYNRRVPERVRDGFGMGAVRIKLGRDEDEVEELASHLTAALDKLWSVEDVRPVDLSHLVKSLRKEPMDLLACCEDYLSSRSIQVKPVKLAIDAMIEVAGNKPVTGYTRADARTLVEHLFGKGNKTGTIRRRVNSLHAVIEHGLLEADVQQRNPFSRILIKNEGKDCQRRGTFSDNELRLIYELALTNKTDTQLILPILGETGARLAEIVGLRWDDVCLTDERIIITSHDLRRLKTNNSEREVPLVGMASEAMNILHRQSDSLFVFSRWLRPTGFASTHASNTLNKWLRRRTQGRTCHCFRHTLRDRLRAVEAPMDMVDQIGGWASTGGVGTRYGHGYSLTHKRQWMERISVR